MSQFFNFAKYEYRMSIRRWAIWVAFLLMGAFFAFSFFIAPNDDDFSTITSAIIWQTAGQIAFSTNIILPVIGGIAASDRMVRDFKLNLNELQNSTPLKGWTYILGKYFGVLAAILTPVLMLSLLTTGIFLIGYPDMPLTLLPTTLLAFLTINVPAYAFVTIFSLAFPLIMPLRVYQILFTGYWFWGNFLNPDAIPNTSNTLLNASGKYAYGAFFGSGFAQFWNPATNQEAYMNLIVLSLCIIVGMFLLERYLRWKTQRA